MTILRPASLDDLATLVEFSRQAFADSFRQLYAPEDLAAFLEDWRSTERISANIADPDASLTLAEEYGALLGYCLIFFGKGFQERPAPQPLRPAFLSQLYCASATTRRGVGSALMDHALDESRQWGCDAVQLSVYSENFGAQRFYARYGFQKVADIDFWVGRHRDDEFLYELRL